jgi:pheromone shutdown-related protein TraB
MNVEKITFADKEIILVGVAHIGTKSLELVNTIINQEKPDIIGVELDPQRFEQLQSEKKWKETDILKVVKEGKAYLLLLNILLSNIQRRYGDSIGIRPGMEMMEAVKLAKEQKIPIELLDRDIKITLKRALSKAGVWEKMKLFFSVIMGIFSEETELTEEDIDSLTQKDVMSELLTELSEHLPSLSEAIIHERDLYIANKILEAHGKKIVAVVGAGHVEGIKKYLDKKRSIQHLLLIPVKRRYFKYLKYLVPASFALIILYGLSLKGFETVLDILLLWILINGGLSALGTLLALGHPFSIITAFLAAPLTSLHPAVAAGWFAGLVETKIKTPRVKDFEALTQLDSLRDFFRNRVTHILLVVAFANIGSVIGTVVALPYLISLLG